jgi:hypothetical protein
MSEMAITSVLRGAMRVALATVFLALLVGPAQARAQEPTPWWSLTTGARPTSLPPGGTGEIIVSAENVGDANADGGSAPIVIKDTLPEGLEPLAIEGIAGRTRTAGNRGPVVCSRPKVTCEFKPAEGKFENGEPFLAILRPFEEIEVRIKVRVRGESGEVNTATVSGGGAPGAVTTSHAITVSENSNFGIEELRMTPEEVGGSLNTQAGSHPFQMTTIVNFNNQAPDSNGSGRAAGLVKDLTTELPAGLMGNPTAVAQCTDTQFAAGRVGPETLIFNECPTRSAVGVATVTFTEPNMAGQETITAPIFNMKPLNGEPARFATKPTGLAPVFLDFSLRSGGDYGVTVTTHNISESVWVLRATLTIWGAPGDARHAGQRGWECLAGLREAVGCNAPAEVSPPPAFITLPTSCQQPFRSVMSGDSWGSSEHPSERTEASYTLPEALDGCNHLPFAPSVRLTPDTARASSPTGLSVDVHVPQAASLNSEGLAESAVKDITVALPPGVAINPAGADGLEACSEAEIGFRGAGPEGLLFTPSLAQPFCPDAAKVGTADISSPLLPASQHVKGFVYLAAQNANPFGSLVAMYVVGEDPISGTLVKLAGETHITETGQIIGIVRNLPQLPFEDAELDFFGGEHGPLATPAKCGRYTTDATFTPWSGGESVASQSSFDITFGPAGAPCPGAQLPFSPAVVAGSENVQAGGFTTLRTTISREDSDQEIGTVQVHMPPGLSGMLSSVKLCPEQQADEGTCGPESKIGDLTVTAGAGHEPITITGGQVYLTEKYAGAPFGLSIVSPVKAGPFDLERDSTKAGNPACDCVVVRARVEVDRHTAALTITADSSGPHAIPHVIDGIPVQIKKVDIAVDRQGFTFNPTNCNPQSISATITGDEGATRSVSVPFQVTDCASLSFGPTLRVTTNAHPTRTSGAALNVKLTNPAASPGTQANVGRVKVVLPKQLPSRLTTLQKACMAATFEANPARCPAASIVGHAKVRTPQLPVPLEGPAYFVSRGGEAFPTLTIVLQGYGLTIDLVGSTSIKKGITSSAFKSSPDVPFSVFELTLPQQRYSALAAIGNPCKLKLNMPTEMVAQDGATIRRTTRIGVSGCPKKHHPKRAKRHKR